MDPKGVMGWMGVIFVEYIYHWKPKHVKHRCIKLASINPTCPSFCKIQNRPTGKKQHQALLSVCVFMLHSLNIPEYSCNNFDHVSPAKKTIFRPPNLLKKPSTTWLNLPVNPFPTRPLKRLQEALGDGVVRQGAIWSRGVQGLKDFQT